MPWLARSWAIKVLASPKPGFRIFGLQTQGGGVELHGLGRIAFAAGQVPEPGFCFFRPVAFSAIAALYSRLCLRLDLWIFGEAQQLSHLKMNAGDFRVYLEGPSGIARGRPALLPCFTSSWAMTRCIWRNRERPVPDSAWLRRQGRSKRDRPHKVRGVGWVRLAHGVYHELALADPGWRCTVHQFHADLHF